VKTHQADLEKQQELARTVAADNEKWAALQKTVEEMQSGASTRTSQASTPPSKADPQAAKAAELAAGQAFLAAFPQARELLIHVGKAQIGRNYAGFFRIAHLSPTQIENLENRTNDLWMQPRIGSVRTNLHLAVHVIRTAHKLAPRRTCPAGRRRNPTPSPVRISTFCDQILLRLNSSTTIRGTINWILA
jgi:hypothetical protein